MLKGKNILIVEDNTMNRVVYSVMLKKEGCQIEFDRWGRETLDKLARHTFDVVILDLMLPHGDSGFSIFEQIRKISKYDEIPIIAVSASEPAIAIPKAQKMGFNGFIAKPLDKNLFPKQLEQLLDGEEIWYAGERFS